MKEFYNKFHPIVESLTEKLLTIRKESSNDKFIGKHPENGNDIFASDGPYGPVLKMEYKVVLMELELMLEKFNTKTGKKRKHEK